jgi:hypothetical protein
MSHDLFGTTPGLFESIEQMAFDEISPDFMPQISCSAYMVGDEQNCLEKLRQRPFVQRKTAALAHSGTISNQHARFKPKVWSSVEKLRCTLVVGACSNFCSDLNNFDNQKWCSIGKVLVTSICPDALTSTIGWLEWPIEKECVPL